MLLNVIDGSGYPQRVIVAGQEVVENRSGSIAVDSISQEIAAANLNRSGFKVQNTGSNPMYINDLGTASGGSGDFVVGVGEYWPPVGYPVSTGAINIQGIAGDTFTAREW